MHPSHSLVLAQNGDYKQKINEVGGPKIRKKNARIVSVYSTITKYYLIGRGRGWKQHPMVQFQIKLDKTLRNELTGTNVDSADKRTGWASRFFSIKIAFQAWDLCILEGETICRISYPALLMKKAAQP